MLFAFKHNSKIFKPDCVGLGLQMLYTVRHQGRLAPCGYGSAFF